MAADVATGITVAFGTSGFSADITDLNPPEWVREWLETTHQGTAVPARTWIPADLGDWGEFSFDFFFDPSTQPPHDDAIEEITITWPDATTWVWDGGMANYAPGPITLNGLMTGSATFKVSGDITIT